LDRLRGPAVAAAVAASALLAGCDASAVTPPQATTSHATSPAASGSPTVPVSPTVSSPPSVSAVSSAGGLTGACITGIYDETQNEFYAMSGLVHGSDMAAGDDIAEAYQLTLTAASARSTVRVTGFSVAFYSGGRKLTSANQTLTVPTVLQRGQPQTLTEHPWGVSVADHGASAGPFATGRLGAVNTAVTCRLVRWRG
jgi:hypothetical protein